MKIPLVKNTIDNKDIDSLIEWLKTYPRLTKGNLTIEFEKLWSEFLGVKHSIFVNSGSSANLLMVYALIESGILNIGDPIIIPSLSWSTSLAPAIQLGLKPILCDCNKKDLSLDDIYNICESKFKENVIYARVIQHIDELEKNFKIMDLSNPMLDENDKKYLTQVVNTNDYHYIPDQFVAFYNEDKLGGMIRNVEFWVKDVFESLQIK